jgi:glycosyltransferase involved in cell wall biosynthesis
MSEISIIVCCYNSENRLKTTLQAIGGSDLSPVRELIVVDNGSTDKTKCVVYTAKEDFPIPVIYISEGRQGLAYARAAGFKASAGEIISFLDDDNEITPDWFIRVKAAFDADKRIGAAGGMILPPRDVSLPRWFHSISANFAVGEQANDTGYVTKDRMLLWGAGLSARRCAIGSFYDKPDNILLVGRLGSQLLAGDDTELCYRIILNGYELYYDKSIVLRHNFDLTRISIRHVLRLNFGFGRARLRLFPYHVRLGKGRIQKYSMLHTRVPMILAALADLITSAACLLFSPRIRTLARCANSYGYLLEILQHHPSETLVALDDTQNKVRSANVFRR